MPAPILLGLIGLAGVATHLFYFKQNEHHFYGVRYLQIALAVFLTAVAGMTRIGEKTYGEAFAVAGAYEGSYLAGVYTSLLIYRALFHPLNKFPGPFGASTYLHLTLLSDGQSPTCTLVRATDTRQDLPISGTQLTSTPKRETHTSFYSSSMASTVTSYESVAQTCPSLTQKGPMRSMVLAPSAPKHRGMTTMLL